MNIVTLRIDTIYGDGYLCRSIIIVVTRCYIKFVSLIYTVFIDNYLAWNYGCTFMIEH
jgi:hypothetical protein